MWLRKEQGGGVGWAAPRLGAALRNSQPGRGPELKASEVTSGSVHSVAPAPPQLPESQML